MQEIFMGKKLTTFCPIVVHQPLDCPLEPFTLNMVEPRGVKCNGA